ncbi:MAG: bifunctional pyr operon transcriptional regulator/uracil phosphoribosyltransferase PyrR, partial [Sphingobacteriales bacterium]|nr:bifunctional pyr operon transcriptional regulator/uracil phosphoribosyltransferase PyrR [Sphingobacteriales bacterium]
MKTILNKQQLQLTILRLAHQLLENHLSLKDVVFIGLQPRGVYVSDKIVDCIKKLCPDETVQYGVLDITFYRDDVRNEIRLANQTNIDFSI